MSLTLADLNSSAPHRISRQAYQQLDWLHQAVADIAIGDGRLVLVDGDA
jgi:hypothetical protein